MTTKTNKFAVGQFWETASGHHVRIKEVRKDDCIAISLPGDITYILDANGADLAISGYTLVRKLKPGYFKGVKLEVGQEWKLVCGRYASITHVDLQSIAIELEPGINYLLDELGRDMQARHDRTDYSLLYTVPKTVAHNSEEHSQEDQTYCKDAGKPDFATVLSEFPLALNGVSELIQKGREKYKERSWDKIPNGVFRRTKCLLRHSQERLAGGNEARDSETGLLHAQAEAWNALCILELILRKKEK